MLEIAVCDDQIDALSNMVHLLNLYRVSKNISFEYVAFSNGFELISALEKGKQFDIYFLDIIMPGFMGIDVAKEIRTFDKTAPIVFLTSSPEFALESYSVKAVNYVLKPIMKEKLFIVLDELLEKLEMEREEDAIIVKSDEGIQRILITNVVYAEVIGRNVLYYLCTGKVIKCKKSFSIVCNQLLKYKCFIKTHRSYIINMNYMDTIGNHRIILHNFSSVPIAQGKAKEIKQQYLKYQMEEE